MNSKIGRNEPCPCGSGEKHQNCCGTYKKEITTVRSKDVGDVELTHGLADALTESLDSSYVEYFGAADSGKSTKDAKMKIATIPEDNRYLTRILDSLDNAFADFDSQAAKLDLPHMKKHTPEIKDYLKFWLRQFRLLLDMVEDYVEEKYSTTGGRS